MCLLKILCRGCSFGKHLSMMFMKFFRRLVFALAFHGGLYQMTFLLRFLLRVGCGLYVSLWLSLSGTVGSRRRKLSG